MPNHITNRIAIIADNERIREILEAIKHEEYGLGSIDFGKIIKQYDRPESFFYCDPPYYATGDYYEDVGFTPADHERLAKALLKIEGKSLLSYNDCPEIRAIYDCPSITIEGTSRLSNIAQRYEGGKQYAELIIANYDITEQARSFFQLTLFDDPENL